MLNILNTYKCNCYAKKCKYNMCAILYNKSKIISIGCNKFIGHSNVLGKKIMLPSRHAEIDVISKFINSNTKYKRQKVNLLVLRLNTNGFGNSKPCANCIRFMKSAGVLIKKVSYYENNRLITTSLNNLHNEHTSSGWKLYYE